MTQPIRSMPELVDALRKRHEELDISFETIDEISGCQRGYASKLLAPNPTKNLGWMSLGDICGALGVALQVVEDPEAIAKVETRWERRKRPQKLPLSIPLSIDHEVPKQIAITSDLQRQLVDPERMRMLGSIGGKARLTKMSRRQRKAIARKAILTRWRRKRESERAQA